VCGVQLQADWSSDTDTDVPIVSNYLFTNFTSNTKTLLLQSGGFWSHTIAFLFEMCLQNSMEKCRFIAPNWLILQQPNRYIDWNMFLCCHCSWQHMAEHGQILADFQRKGPKRGRTLKQLSPSSYSLSNYREVQEILLFTHSHRQKLCFSYAEISSKKEETLTACFTSKREEMNNSKSMLSKDPRARTRGAASGRWCGI
jgi:hypothetical protein